MNKSISVIATTCLLTVCVHAQILIEENFNKGTVGWSLFVPETSDRSAIVVETVPSPEDTENSVLKMGSSLQQRFSLSSWKVPVRPGTQYRLSCRFLNKSGVEVAENTPGFLIRVTASDRHKNGLSEHHIHLDVDGKSHSTFIPMGHLATIKPSQDWQTVQALFTFPEGVAFVHVDLFFWRMKGELFLDDFLLEEIDGP